MVIPMENYYLEPNTDKVVAPQKKSAEYSYIESVFALITFVLGFIFIKLFPAASRPLGSVIFTLLMFASAFVFMCIKGVKHHLFPSVIAISGLVLSFAMFLNTNGFVNTIIFLYVAVAYCYWIFTAFGNKIGEKHSDFLALEAANALFVMPFKSYANIFLAGFALINRGGMKRVALALCGLIAAVIPTAVVSLLLSYDQSFSEMMDIIISSPAEFIFENIPTLIISIPVSMYFFGLLYSCSNNVCADKMTAEACEKSLLKIKAIPTIATVFAALPVLAVYVIYFISQSTYYLSAFSKNLPEGLSYAEYARSGFFELCMVAIINAAIVAAVNAFTNAESKAAKIAVKMVNIIFPVATLVLIVTAISKMVLYIGRYGLTEKRVLATWLMLMLFIGFTVFIFKQFISKIKLSAVFLALFLVFTLPLSYCNIDGVIAKYNVDSFLNGRLNQVDVYELSSLGASGLPQLIKLRDSGKCDENLYARVDDAISGYYAPEGIFEQSLPSLIAVNISENQ